MNILNQRFDSPYGTAPFSKIKTADFIDAFKTAITKSKAQINAICNNLEAPSFQNTIEALEFSALELERISSIFFNLNAAETNGDIQQIAQQISPILAEFSNDVALNEVLFSKIKSIFEQKDSLTLTQEQAQLLGKKYKSFSRNGALLNTKDKEHLREIDKALSKLKLTFGEHLLAETNNFELHILEESKLEGLPDDEKEAAKLRAIQKEKKGWIISLDYPSYVPFMKYAKNRELRRRLALAFGRKGFQNNELDNQKIVLEIAKLRFQRANLLGYKTHADYILEERMAKTPQTVKLFLSDLLEKARPFAQKEFENLSQFAQKIDGLKTLQKWDNAYYSEQLKKQQFDIDDAQLKPYFKLENVIDGAFQIAEKLFGLQFEEVQNIDTYHQDVKTYRVVDDSSNLVAVFYADFFPRQGKRSGAWMTSFKPQYKLNGHNERPHVSIVCNFTKPTQTKPSLLTFNEVTTLFHEFGHALHGMLADTTYPSLSGTSVAWDFVELPSQLMENWCFEKEALNLFAKHYKTGKLIPIEWIEKLKAAGKFQQGIQTLRQLSFGLLDMSWHAQDPSNIKDVKTHEKEIFRRTQLFPDVAENCMSTAFAHIFQGGYSSGYYSYKWAEVLDADAFAFFKSNGVFNTEISERLKEHILSKGGTEEPHVLYKRFRGESASNKALLERAGLL
ncbi:peptidase, M3 family [Formosa sp. Hel3_A1_48]|uniref:M3 family metallopeptidase n=1 Tax=Formosa sp. Hel3_A1_48 TaxID=1336795 RepID=UPI00084E163C|nr:M3 family metallopeptidase [Formosa sp. Hel3_A1_48]AOR25984.1 peptidase, M3 family [Formosa sp. Hel3_A1_48]MDC0950695.1 M3 family metallopeptidase [Flavobacteriaceae bacterium]